MNRSLLYRMLVSSYIQLSRANSGELFAASKSECMRDINAIRTAIRAIR